MKLWETITGSDISREWRAFDERAGALPEDYRQAWEQIKTALLPHGGFTGRSLSPVLDGVLGLLETSAADGQSATEALGEDIPAFCAALIGGDASARDYRQRWRDQLNRNVARRLSRLED